MSKIVSEVLQAGRIGPMADQLQLARTSVISAIERGEIPVIQTVDGLDLVTTQALKEWSKNRPKRGRKPRA